MNLWIWIKIKPKINNFKISLTTKPENSNVEIKSCDVDLVTIVDKLVEDTLMNGITAKFPDHKYVDCNVDQFDVKA